MSRQVIWKCRLKIDLELQDIELPEDAQILTVQMQAAMPVLWALVDPDRPLSIRRVKMFGTGHEFDRDIGRYLGTVQQHGAQFFVWHFFELTDSC